jgi:V/A-type H+-transporting ATPase subunit F
MKRVAFITPPDVGDGFLLGGIPQHAADVHEAEDMIREVMGEPDTGLVVVDERLMKGLSEERLKEIQRGWPGILLVLPSPERPSAPEEDYALRLIRRAIGYHVKLKL